MSLDGYIAGPGDDLSFLDAAGQEGEDYGYQEFMAKVDTVITGRRTYNKVLSMVPEWPHKDISSYILTREKKEPEENVIFYNGKPGDLAKKLKASAGKDIFVDGGAYVVNELLKDNLIDEFYITIIPVLLGDGVALFKGGPEKIDLERVNTTSYENGLVQLHYRRKE